MTDTGVAVHPHQWSRAIWAAAEPFTLATLFTAEIRAVLTDRGVSSRASFIAARCAPMGRADASVVAAAFHGMPFAFIESAITGLWETLDPADVIEAHHRTVAQFAGRVLADVDPEPIVRFGDRLTGVVAGLDTAGRPLAAANQAVAAPTEPWARFWRALNTIREYRGDGHIAALVGADLTVPEALRLTAVWGEGHVYVAQLRKSRGLDDDVWGAAGDRLAARGLLDGDGALTPAGTQLRDDIEEQTDRLSARPWTQLDDTEVRELYQLLTTLSARLVDGGEMLATTAVGAPWPPPPLA